MTILKVDTQHPEYPAGAHHPSVAMGMYNMTYAEAHKQGDRFYLFYGCTYKDLPAWAEISTDTRHVGGVDEPLKVAEERHRAHKARVDRRELEY